MAKKKSKNSGGNKKGGKGARKRDIVTHAKSSRDAKVKDDEGAKVESGARDESAANSAARDGATADDDEAAPKAKGNARTDDEAAADDKAAPKAKGNARTDDEAAADDKAALKAKANETPAASSDGTTPDLATKLVMVDNAIGYIEQAFLVVALFSLIGVGTYQFVASHIFKINSTWPFEALRNLVFFTAMGGAALAAQKGRMISMDFVARKFSPKNRVILRIFITVFVVFTCYLLFKGGMYVRNAAGAHYEVFNPRTALLVLPVGAALIAVHYTLHALTDAIYLSAGLIPPEEEGPAAH